MQNFLDKTDMIKKASNNYTRITIKSEDVYEMLRTIPAGMVSTYGDLAKALGNPSASRYIGRILSKNPNPIVVLHKPALMFC